MNVDFPAPLSPTIPHAFVTPRRHSSVVEYSDVAEAFDTLCASKSLNLYMTTSHSG